MRIRFGLLAGHGYLTKCNESNARQKNFNIILVSTDLQNLPGKLNLHLIDQIFIRNLRNLQNEVSAKKYITKNL